MRCFITWKWLIFFSIFEVCLKTTLTNLRLPAFTTCSSLDAPTDNGILNYAISNRFSLFFFHCVISSSSWMWELSGNYNQYVFTQANDSSCFQPHSNKAEKFDYVSDVPPVFISVQTMNSKMWDDYFSAQRYAEKHVSFFFLFFFFLTRSWSLWKRWLAKST